MSTEDLESLIERLHQLRLERQRILNEEERTIASLRDLTRSRARRQHQNRGVSPDPTEHPHPGVFEVGQHVYIDNRIRHVPLTRRTTPADRAAVVARVTVDRIYIQTYNGYETWRHPGNLRHLTDRERANIGRP